jgi:hypothetical protein
MSQYANLTVSIAGHAVTAWYSTASGITDNVSGNLDRRDRLRETLDVLTGQLLADRLHERAEFELLGSCLFDHLISDKVAQRVDKWLSELPEGQELRIVLQFTEHESSEVMARPWEYLRIPTGKRKGFVAAQEQLVLSRQIRMESDSPVASREPAAEQLRILVGIASPEKERLPRWGPWPTQAKGDLANVSDVAEELVRRLEDSKAEVAVKSALTVDGLSEALKVGGFRPHVVHLVAHGDIEEGRGGSLALCDAHEPRLAAWTRDTDLADAVGHLPSLVFLHACSSAQANQVRGFRGVAMRLVERGVPAVVAMNFEIPAGLATQFAIQFYEELAKGAAVDRAVQLGRQAIGRAGGVAGNYTNRVFGCPVAFVQVPGAVILPTELAEPTRPVESPERPSVYQCPACLNAVASSMRRCFHCRARLAPCPSCSRLWVPEAGFCTWCDYEPTSLAGAAASPAPKPTTPSAHAATLTTSPVKGSPAALAQLGEEGGMHD